MKRKVAKLLAMMMILSVCSSAVVPAFAAEEPEPVVPQTETGVVEQQDEEQSWSLEGIEAADEAIVGDPVSLLAKVSGNTQGLTYAFSVEKDNQSSLIQDFGASLQTEWLPEAAGQYTLSVTVQDAQGKQETESKVIAVKEKEIAKPQETQVEQPKAAARSLYSARANTWTFKGINTSAPSPQRVNTEITITPEMEGDTTGVKYRVVSFRDNWEDRTVWQEYSTNSNITFRPTKAGKYVIYMDVQGSDGTFDSKLLEFTVTEAWTFKGINTSAPSPQRVNTEITITPNIEGNTTGVKYRVVSFRDNWEDRTVWQEYSTNSNITFRPTKAGKYIIYMDVLGADGKFDSKVLEFTVTEAWTFKGINTNAPSPQQVNTEIKLTPNIEGNTTGVKYRVVSFRDNWEDRTVWQEYSTNSNIIFKPTKAGKYIIYMDVLGTDGKFASEALEFTVTESWIFKKINTNVSSPQKVNTEIKLTPSIEGDTTGVKYRVVSFRDNWEDRTVWQEYSTNSNIIFKPTKAGKYIIYMDVLGTDGKFASEALEFTVTENWIFKGINTNIFSPQRVNTEIKLTPNIEGDTTGVKYRVVSFRDNWEDRTVWQEYSINSNITFKPTKTGKYTIYMDVLGADGKFDSKVLEFTVTEAWTFKGIKTNISSPQRANTEIRLTPEVEGDTTGVKYRVVSFRDNWEDRTVWQEYSANSNIAFRPTKPGKYIIYIDVQGADGKFASDAIEFMISGSGGATVNSIMLSHSNVSVSADKSIYVEATSSPGNRTLYWFSNNTSVATVSTLGDYSNKGFIKGVNPGTATISVMDASGSIVKTCTVTVTEAEAVQFSYTQENSCLANSTITLVAITNKKPSSVRFLINGGSYISAGSPTVSGNTYVWKATVKAPSSAGNHTAWSDALVNGSWKSGKEFSVFVSNSQSMSQTSLGERRVSDKGINFIAQSEGLDSSGTPYEDSIAGNVPTIGYGLVLFAGNTFYNNLTQEMAYALLLDKVNNGDYASSVNKLLTGNGIKFSQQQFDALVSFTYNLGPGWTNKDLGNMIKNIGGNKDLNNINAAAFQKEVSAYHHAGDKCYRGLLYRRWNELAIFFYGDYTRRTNGSNPYGFPNEHNLK